MNVAGSIARQRCRRIMSLVTLMHQLLTAIPSPALEGPPPKAAGEDTRSPPVPGTPGLT